MGRNGVKVIIRTRPTANFATQQLQIDTDENAITVYNGSGPMSGVLSPVKPISGPSNRKDCWQFKFHQVLHNVGQDRVYEFIARDIVHGTVVNGINGTIMAYGQTGAGKSFTMIGDTQKYHHRGIAPRAIAHLFEEIESRIELQYIVHVSYMEIYNDRIYDLLGRENKGEQDRELVVIEDAHGTNVRGLTQVQVFNEQDALSQLFHGELERTVAEHQLNKRSNRSHCIFTFHIAQKSRVEANERMTLSKLHLVDLAGSERLKKTLDSDQSSSTNSSTIKKESMYINQSLSFLEQCIVALGSKEPRHIPYRQTKLTNVLKDSLGGNSNTLMFACIWGESRQLEETISTLKLAQRMMRVHNEVASIVETDPMLLIRKYERQIRELKHELILHDAFADRSAVIYDEHTPEQKKQLMQRIQRYIDAETQEKEDETLSLTSIHEIRELFRQFKLLYKKNAQVASIGTPSTSDRETTSLALNIVPTESLTIKNQGAAFEFPNEGSNGDDEMGVGEDEPGAGFALGLVSDTARPLTMEIGRLKHARGARKSPIRRSPSPVRPYSKNEERPNHEEGFSPMSKDRDESGDDRDIRDKNAAFQIYRLTGAGKKLYTNLQDEKEKRVDATARVKQTTRRVNAAKAQIDTIRSQLDAKRVDRSDQAPEIVDEEEFLLLTAEREAKRAYRALFRDLKDAKAELEFTLRTVELVRRQVVREFEAWYEEKRGRNEREERDDEMDDGEQFQQLELDRVRAQDPDAIAFFQAQKQLRSTRGNRPASQRHKR